MTAAVITLAREGGSMSRYGLAEFKKSRGAKLVSVEKIGDDLVLATDRGVLRLIPEGDCCSTSWIESFECDGEGGEILRIEESPEDNDDEVERGGDDVIKVYFGTIYTTKGRVSYELRNSSNGYYGGWLNHAWSTREEFEAFAATMGEA